MTPDNFHVNKHDMVITDRMINDKHIRLVRKADGDCIEEVVPADEARAQVLSDAQVLELADYAKQIEKHYGCYMDMEWGIDERDGKLWILQARPETTHFLHRQTVPHEETCKLQIYAPSLPQV